MKINNTLEIEKVIDTIKKLHGRIIERFPGSSLGDTCKGFYHFTIESKTTLTWINQPIFYLRNFGYITIFILILAIFYCTSFLKVNLKITVTETIPLIESFFNNLVLMGVAIFFLYSLEDRLKRKRAIKFLNKIKGFAHVVDMHQLTKDPQIMYDEYKKTNNSPERSFDKFELQRYLVYSTEFLSLIGKVAALYSQNFPDKVIVQASSEIESLCSNTNNKIWQKLIILNFPEK